MRMTAAMTFLTRPILLAPLLLLALPGCISLGGEPPESLLTLNPEARAPAGQGIAQGGERPVVAVLTFDTPAKLDVLLLRLSQLEARLEKMEASQQAFQLELLQKLEEALKR